MMSRSQISLVPELQRRARQRAAQLGVSMAEYIRRLVARDLDQLESTADPASVFDLGASTGSDVAVNKDGMLAEAAAAEHARARRRRKRR